MSRISLTSLESAARETPGLEVTVGWDRPLATYFAIVSREDEPADKNDADDADPVLLDPAPIIAAIGRFAILPDDLADRLAADRASEGARPRATWMR
jgi:hypothetical protein